MLCPKCKGVVDEAYKNDDHWVYYCFNCHELVEHGAFVHEKRQVKI